MKYLTLAILFTTCCLGSAAQVPEYISTDGLLAWYPFSGNLKNEYNGPANDGNGFGTIGYEADRSGGGLCYRGDGANGIDIPNHNFPGGNAARSISVFYKNSIPYTPGLHQLIAWGNDGAAGQLFGIVISDSTVGVDYKGGAVYTRVTPDSSWHNVTVTYPANGEGSSSIKLYYDGLPSTVVTQGSISALATETGPVHNIGTLSMTTNKYSWLGNIDDVAIWNRELTPCEVQLAANSYRVRLDSIPDSCQSPSGALKANVTGGTAPYHYQWSPGITVDENSIGSLQQGLYSVTVTDANGCAVHAQAWIFNACALVKVAEGLSPNGDGLNDTWQIDNLYKYPDNIVEVYDQWGNKVYEQSNYKNDWDGKSKGGARLPDGNYFYLVKLNVPDVGLRKGVLTGQLLIRR